MTVKQISLITMKSGEKVNLPDALDEAEICFTTDTGEVFIGAPNFGPIQYRSDQSSVSNGQGISPYRNLKILTELDVIKTITGEYYTQAPLVSVTLPLTTVPYTVYTFDKGINSAVVSFSLYDGKNVNLVGDIYLCTFGGNVTVCMAGMRDPGVVFSGLINDSGQLVLQTTNTTFSQYTLYLAAKCWESSLATWDGEKGDGVAPTCYAGNGDGTGGGIKYLSKLLDVKLMSPPGDKQILAYNAADERWENITANFDPEIAIHVCDDVQLNNLTGGQVLQYNSTDGKWENVNANLNPVMPEVAIHTCDDVKLNDLAGGQVLQYNSTDGKWENVTANLNPTMPEVAIHTCDDVVLSNVANGNVLQFDSSSGKWKNVTANLNPVIPAAPEVAIHTCDDVVLSNVANGNVLQYDSSSGKWKNTTANLNPTIPEVAIRTCDDVVLSNVADGNVLQWNAASGKWKNVTANLNPSMPEVAIHTCDDVVLSNVANGNVLQYNSSTGKWNNATLNIPAAVVNNVRISAFFTTYPQSSETISMFIADTNYYFPANFAGSIARVLTSPSAVYTLVIYNTPNGSSTPSEIGFITVSTAGVCSFGYFPGASMSVSKGDMITVVGSATVDYSVANFAATIVLTPA